MKISTLREKSYLLHDLLPNSLQLVALHVRAVPVDVDRELPFLELRCPIDLGCVAPNLNRGET